MEHGFHVLQNFTAFVKGSGYLTAGVLLLSIVLFWIFLTGEEKRRH